MSKTDNTPVRLKRNVNPRAAVITPHGQLSQKKSLNRPAKAAKVNSTKEAHVTMPIRLRIGLNEKRPTFTPALGEPLFTTDDRRFWVGDGLTPGGIPVSVSQWPIDKVDDLALLEDAEVGDFAFYRDRTRCFMLINPPPSSDVAWMELTVEPLRSDEERRAKRYLSAIQEYLIDVLIEERFASDDADRLTPKRVISTKIAKLMRDRRLLNTYLADTTGEVEFPELQFTSYHKL